MRKDKNLAIKLRLQGFTYNQISEKLGIPKSTLSNWLKNIQLTTNAKSKINNHIYSTKIVKLIARNKQKTEIARQKNKIIRKLSKEEAKKFFKDPLFIIGLALYWGEGYKKGAEGSKWKSIDFANSDPAMIKVMIKFFLTYLPIKKTDVKIQIMLHNPKNNEQSIKFWQHITGLKKENFIKTSYVISKSSKKKMSAHLPHGTVHIRINNVNLFFRLIGWIDFMKETM
jgi:transcriptional regulator with XRE-family HTH domain